MLHEIGHHIFNNTFSNREVSQKDVYIIVKDRQLLVQIQNGDYQLPSYQTVGKLKSRYLFSIDEIGFFMAEPQEIEGYQWISSKQLRFYDCHWLRYGMLVGVSLVNWYQNNRYCGRCGQLTQPSFTERALVCNCGNHIYPRINPVVIIGVIDNQRMLLTKYTDPTRFARYALVAGFIEFGETLEQAVSREVYEETGLKVKDIHYYGSQPWPFSDSLIFGIFARLDGSDTVRFIDHELNQADWLKPEDMPDEKEQASITYQMMQAFKLKGEKVLDD